MLADDEMNYTLVDINGDHFNLVIKKREKLKYDYDHLLTCRAISNLKRNGIKPINRALEDQESADLRSPSAKKPKAKAKAKAKPQPQRGGKKAKSLLPKPVEVNVVLPEKEVFLPNAESTVVEDKENGTDLGNAVRSLNESFDVSLILNPEDEINEGVKPLAQDIDVVVLPIKEDAGVAESSWTDPNACHMFLNHMGKNMDLMKKARKKSAYVKISADMRADNFAFSSEALEKKKRGLDAQYCYYKKKAPHEQIKWEYFEAMDYLSVGRWPVGFVSQPKLKAMKELSDKEGAVGGNISDEGAAGWDDNDLEGAVGGKIDDVEGFDQWDTSEQFANDDNNIYFEVTTGHDDNVPAEVLGKAWGTLEADKALLEEVHECKDFYINRPLLKNVDLFKRVALRLADRSYFITWENAQARYNAIKTKFHEENDKIQGTGAGGCKWELFDLVYELEKDSVSTKPKVTVSAGAKANISKAVACVEAIQKGKKRAPNDTRQKRLTKLKGGELPSKPIGLKDRALSLAERKYELDMEFVNTFKGYREDAKVRGENFMKGILLLKELKGTTKDQNNN